MLLRKGSVILFVLVLLSIVTVVSAGAVSPTTVKKSGNGGYFVLSGYTHSNGSAANSQAGSGSVIPMTVGSSIQQGQTNWHYKYINQGCPGFYVDLNWGNPSNDLQVTIFTPDGYVLGPFDDTYPDGSLDGRVYIYIGRNGGLTGGTYYERVYGLSVSGTQYYTI